MHNYKLIEYTYNYSFHYNNYAIIFRKDIPVSYIYNYDNEIVVKQIDYKDADIDSIKYFREKIVIFLCAGIRKEKQKDIHYIFLFGEFLKRCFSNSTLKYSPDPLRNFLMADVYNAEIQYHHAKESGYFETPLYLNYEDYYKNFYVK